MRNLSKFDITVNKEKMVFTEVRAKKCIEPAENDDRGLHI